jgi:hypothetical protein
MSVIETYLKLRVPTHQEILYIDMRVF